MKEIIPLVTEEQESYLKDSDLEDIVDGEFDERGASIVSMRMAAMIVRDQYESHRRLSEKRIAELEQAVSRLKDKVPTDGWISVKDRLPGKGVDVLCYSRDRGIVIDQFDMMVGPPDKSTPWFRGTRENYDTHITHWMPLVISPPQEQPPLTEQQ